MRTLALSLSLPLFLFAALSPLTAQPPPPKLKTFTSSAEVQQLIAKAKSERKNNQPVVVEHILTLPPYGANLEYRASAGGAAVHETDAEMFYVIEGAATLVTGGKLIDGKRTNLANLAGTGIEGGTTRKVAKGDFIFVPQGVPHQFSAIDSTLVLMSFHVPRTSGDTE